MGIKYFDATKITAESLGNLLGVKIKEISIGNIETGQTMEMVDYEGNKVTIPVREKGIEIEFEYEPKADQLAKLDRFLVGYKREGGKTIAQEIDELTKRIKAIEDKVK